MPVFGRRRSERARLPGSRARFRPTFRTGAPYLVPLLAAAAVAWAAWHWRDALLAAGSSLSLQAPETQVRQALAHQDRAHLEDVYGFQSGGTLELVPVRFSDVVPVVEGGRATVVAMLDAEGRAVWRDQAAKVSYIGRESFHMRPCTIALWCAEGDQFARLRGVLRALFRKDDALRGRDAPALDRLVAEDYRDGDLDRAALLRRVAAEMAAGADAGRRPRAWQIRVERDGAEVGEDYEATGPDGASQRRRARYRLVRRDDRWLFASGL